MSPPPLTSQGCDLRDFAFMPLDVVRLRDSDFAAISDGDEFRAGLLLWCASWHQVPAASLPDDDTVLARLAGYGRVVKEWQKVRNGSLRGWIKCGDGRLYHPVIAEKANEAWRAKLTQRWRTECSRIKKHNQRHGTNLPFPDLDAYLDSHVSSNCPSGHFEDVPEDTPGMYPDCPSGNDIQGTGIGTETGRSSSSSSKESTHSGRDSDAPSLPPLPEASEAVQRIGLVCRLLRSHGINCNPGQFQGKYRGLENHTDDDFHLAIQTLKDRGEQSIGIGLVAAVLGDIALQRQQPVGTHTRRQHAGGGQSLTDKNAAAFTAAREMIFGAGDGGTEREIQP